MTEPDELVGANVLARHFDVTVATVRRWVREQRIPCVRVSRRVVRFNIRDVERALSQPARRGATSKGGIHD